MQLNSSAAGMDVLHTDRLSHLTIFTEGRTMSATVNSNVAHSKGKAISNERGTPIENNILPEKIE